MSQRTLRAKLLDMQAQYERRLAAKQSDPELKRMIENSAVGKEEKAQELRTGRPIDPEHSQYEKRLERSLPQKVIVSTRR